MKGTIKHYNHDRGFGLIAVSGGPDHFFHVSQLNGQDPPQFGDTVSFDPTSRGGKPAAKNVRILDRKAIPAPNPAPNQAPYYGNAQHEWTPQYEIELVPSDKPFKPVPNARPYYGKPQYRVDSGPSDKNPKPASSTRPYYGKPHYRIEYGPSDKPFKEVAPAKVFVGGAGGVIGWVLGGPLGGLVGAGIGAALADIERKEVEITSPCMRCGGTGQVTARVNGRTGFQCEKCRHFWKVKDDKL